MYFVFDSLIFVHALRDSKEEKRNAEDTGKFGRERAGKVDI